MLAEVEVTASSHALEFFAHEFTFFVALAERKLIKDVHRRARVMSQLVRLLPILDQRIAGQADAFVKAQPFLDPILVPDLPAPGRLRFAGMARASRTGHLAINGFDGLIGPDEEFQFHLLELARSESVITRIDFVSKRFANL